MTYIKIRPLLSLIAVCLLFAVLKALLHALVGFSYGNNSMLARMAHDTGQMIWGAVLVSLLRCDEGWKQSRR
jgi:hypothetical protein